MEDVVNFSVENVIKRAVNALFDAVADNIFQLIVLCLVFLFLFVVVMYFFFKGLKVLTKRSTKKTQRRIQIYFDGLYDNEDFYSIQTALSKMKGVKNLYILCDYIDDGKIKKVCKWLLDWRVKPIKNGKVGNKTEAFIECVFVDNKLVEKRENGLYNLKIFR